MTSSIFYVKTRKCGGLSEIVLVNHFRIVKTLTIFCSKHVNRCKRYDTITLEGLQTNVTNKVDGGVRLGLHPNICQVGPLK